MRYDIKRGNTVIANIRPTGKITSRIMGEELVNMSFALVRKIEFAMGDYVDVKGRRYYLLDSPTIVQKSTKEWQYTLTFKSVKYRLTDVSMLFYDELNNLTVPTFDIMGTAEKMIDLVITNANRDQSGWTKGIIDNTETKLVSFDDINCLSALAKIADEFKLEYWIDADQSIHFTERKPQANITLEYGRNKGLKTLTQTPLADASIVTRLYVKGSDKNLPIKYRNGQKNLRMDVPYLEKNVDKYGVIEHTETFDDIYPHRIGTVTSVDANNPFVFTDNTIDFDLNATDGHGNTTVLIKGLSAKVTFQTGQLAGYILEIKEYGYNSQTKTFTLLPNKEEKAWNIPSDVIRPAVGDTYILSDIQMPAQYVADEEGKLKIKGQNYLDLNSTQRFTYTGESDPLLFKALNYQLSLGSMIRLKSVEFSLDSDVRITGLTEDLQNPYDVQPDFSDVTYTSSIVRQFYKQEKQQQTIIKEQKYNAAAARAAYYFGLELSEKTFDSEGYFDVTKIKPASIDTKLISLGGRMQQFSLPDVNFYLENNYTSLRNTSGRIVHLTIGDTPRTWYIASNTILNIGAVYQYVYVKCQRNGTNANILVTSNQIMVEQDPDFFHFEAGYISSIQNGFRVCKMTYGFAQINPQEISIGRWTSPVGGDYIAFNENGIEIKGKVTFASDSPALNQVQEKIDAVQVGSVNLLDNTAYLKLNPNSVGYGTSILIENEGEKFYRATPDLGKNVSLFGAWFTLENNQEYVRGIYVRHSASEPQDVRIYSNSSNVGGDKVTTIQPNIWTFIKTSTINGSGNSSALIMEVATLNISLDYKKAILVKGNRLGNDWMPSANDVQNEITVAKQNAANAQNAANIANQEAIEAKKVLSDIANDNIVTAQEKPTLLQRWKTIESERPKHIAQAGTYNVNTDNYNNYYFALANYLTNTGVFVDMLVSTNVDGRELENNFHNYYDVRTDLNKAITDAAKNYANTLVDNIKIGGQNLVNYSANPWKENSPSVGFSNATLVNNDGEDGGLYVNVTGAPCYMFVDMPYMQGKFIEGKDYTISLEVWSLWPLLMGIGDANMGNPFDNPTSPANGGWIRIFRTFKYVKTTQNLFLIYFQAPVGTNYLVRNFKIEEGNKATPWTASQADIDRQLKRAQDDANIANQKLSDIASDNKLTSSEKNITMKEWAVIYNERPELIATASIYGVSAVVYDGKVNDLAVYLNNIGYSDLSYTSNINGNEFRQKFVDVYTAKADLIKRISDTTKNYTNATTEAAKIEMAKDALNKALSASYASGNCLYRDVDFRNGMNGTMLYNNAGNNTNAYLLTYTNIYNAPTRSPQCLVFGFRANGQPTEPGYGGFTFATPTRANAVFITRMIARFPAGIKIEFAANPYGNDGSYVWTTSQYGTGRFEEYICIVRCGGDGSFSSINYFWFNDMGYGNRAFETIVAYASVFDMTDVDMYLEDKIKQNEQQTAIAKAQADNALATSNITSQKVSFLSTTINNNVVSTGTLEVGDVVGANAGITGVTDRGRQSVRVYAGSPYANKNTAPFTLQDDGLIKMHHPNGNKGFELGIVDGKLVFNVYDDVGNKIMEMGSAGIIFANYIPDSWSTFYLGKFNSSSYNPYNLNEVSSFANANTKQEMLNNPGNINDPEHWLVTIPKSDSEWVNYSQYSAGTSYDSNTYKKYEGIYYKGTLQKPQKPNDYTEKLADGWYYYTVSTHVWKQRGNPNMNGRYEYAFTLFRLSQGQLVETLNYELSGIV
ncbi:phage tail protein [Elizabethkingia anophelis]|nr:phage tail protein [Elizabethkingia anophelis]UKY89754.1 phage tail protein [Elizabethkingia anophelis]UKY96924.1 phage tail protein [Elizabethkingia anophelis]